MGLKKKGGGLAYFRMKPFLKFIFVVVGIFIFSLILSNNVNAGGCTDHGYEVPEGSGNLLTCRTIMLDQSSYPPSWVTYCSGFCNMSGLPCPTGINDDCVSDFCGTYYDGVRYCTPQGTCPYPGRVMGYANGYGICAAATSETAISVQVCSVPAYPTTNTWTSTSCLDFLGICGTVACTSGNPHTCTAPAKSCGTKVTQLGLNYVCDGAGVAYRTDSADVTSGDGVAYTKCADSKVCQNSPSGGVCSLVSSSGISVSTDDTDDSSENVVSIADVLNINLAATYTGVVTSPSWGFIYDCFISKGGGTACQQGPSIASVSEKNAFYPLISNDGTISSSFAFTPGCSASYLGTFNVQSAELYTGLLMYNNWLTDGKYGVSQFTVVQCETNDNADAQAVANFADSGTCAAGLDCANSYCSSNVPVACATDLDNPSACTGASGQACCEYYTNPYGQNKWTYNNLCCGDDANEVPKTCSANAADYPSGYNACTDASNLLVSAQGCCPDPNGCFDSVTKTCYNDGENVYIARHDEYSVCTKGVWNKGSDGHLCKVPSKDCKSGLKCADDDYDGDLTPTGKCADCNSATSSFDICGTIAWDGSTWSLCNGAGLSYTCYDQVAPYCVTPEPDSSKTSPDAAGIMTSGNGISYSRCASNAVCSGGVRGGTCSQVDSSALSVTLADSDSDGSNNIISISDNLNIILSANYAGISTSPSWGFIYECLVSKSGVNSNCEQSPGNVGVSQKNVFPPLLSNGAAISSTYTISPSCTATYLGSYNVRSAELYTGLVTNNNWLTASQYNTQLFTFVQCEDNIDAQALANYADSNTCAPGLDCALSYCDTGNKNISCPTDLDFPNTCTGSNGSVCCNHYGYTWTWKNDCCGDDASEFSRTCQANAGDYGSGCSPCTDNSCAVLSVNGCCDEATDCFDPFTKTCYNNNYNGSVGMGNFYAVCTNGVWNKGADSNFCTSATKDCKTGLKCIDDDYDGDLTPTGKCGDCNAATNFFDICGAVASDGTTWSVCKGDGTSYTCYDQSVADGDGYCIKNNALVDPSKSSANEGGKMNVSTEEGTNRVRCDGSKVCSGNVAMSWANGNAGGNCIQVDTSQVAVNLDDVDDTTDTKISIYDTLQIKLNATYSKDAAYSDNFLWKFLFGCWISGPAGTKDGCEQNPSKDLSNNYLLAFNSVSPLSESYVNFDFNASCNYSYIGSYNVDFAKVYSGWLINNNWLDVQSALPAQFQVVKCEDNIDAQALANLADSQSCSPGFECNMSYCVADTTVIPCPTDLDNTTGCLSGNAQTCCAYYNFTWIIEGENFTAFGGYGNKQGNSNQTYPDTGNINNVVAECCGDDMGEYLAKNISFGENLTPGGLCCANQHQCVAKGTCNNDSSIGGHETCKYDGDCSGVGALSSCYDGYDNDCDNYMDFCDGVNINCPINGAYSGDRRDPDCLSIITGKVYSTNGSIITNAFVKAKQRVPMFYNFTSDTQNTFLLEYRVYTNSSGEYQINVNGNLTYDVIAGKETFSPSTSLGASVGFRQIKVIDFTLNTTITECNPDCTTSGSPVCNPACEGWNGCDFYNVKSQQLCDGKKPDFKVTYSDLGVQPVQDIICCEGSPTTKPAVLKLDKKVATDKKNLVRVTRPIVLDGNQVTMVVDVFSQD